MAKMVQVRNVPDELHRQLKARAASLGMSLSEYLLSEMRRIAEIPTLEEFDRRLRRRRRVVFPSGETPTDIVRRIRDEAG